MEQQTRKSYWKRVWEQFMHHKLGVVGLFVVALFVLIGVYAPLLASSKPLVVYYEGSWYFPLLRYLFFSGFYTKRIDIFYNLMMFTAPLWLLGWCLLKHGGRRWWTCLIAIVQLAAFSWLLLSPIKDPASDVALTKKHQEDFNRLNPPYHGDPLLSPFPHYDTWEETLAYMSPYERLNLVLRYEQRYREYLILSQGSKKPAASLWYVDRQNEERLKNALEEDLARYSRHYEEAKAQLPALIEAYKPCALEQKAAHTSVQEAYNKIKEVSTNKAVGPLKSSAALIASARDDYQIAKSRLDTLKSQCQEQHDALANARDVVEGHDNAIAKLAFFRDRHDWLEQQVASLQYEVMPFFRPYHWEDDAGGDQNMNHHVHWWERTRINRKDLMAGLIFGIRISLVVGILSVALALAVGLPIGALAGFFAGKTDIIVCRLLEIWESMPTFFMLLTIITITQSKSIFLVIGILGLFGWTSISRFLRGEVLKQRHLPYVEACTSIGYPSSRIIFRHILPNAIPPVLTLLPFAIMAAITSEAGLSFLGLGEEGSCSWGVLMDEGRTVFPGESYLLWPPAILLTLLLVAIALVGDALRDAIDPKLRR